MTPPPIVYILDDDEPTRKAMARLLQLEGLTVKTFGSAEDFLSDWDTSAPGCLILDMRMPGISGLDVQRAVLQREETLPIVFLSGQAVVPESVQAMQRGAVDFLVKPVEGEVLLDAVKRAIARGVAARAARAEEINVRERYGRLTEREREVFVHLISGQLNKQIAGDLHISERTIKLHRARIFEKLETDSLAGLARIAVRLGIEPASQSK
jgi:FixJ family two-component response regulator